MKYTTYNVQQLNRKGKPWQAGYYKREKRLWSLMKNYKD